MIPRREGHGVIARREGLILCAPADGLRRALDGGLRDRLRALTDGERGEDAAPQPAEEADTSRAAA